MDPEVPTEGDSLVPTEGDSLVQAATKVLNTASPWAKADASDKAVALWMAGGMPVRNEGYGQHNPPDKPARATLKVVEPGRGGKLRKGGSLASRVAILHSLAHIESWAIDLAWDVIARWGADPDYTKVLPREFFHDFVIVAADECRHFRLLSKRLEELGSFYGALPVHDGLWESAERTSSSLPARLAVEHAVHEARGLDRLPVTIENFKRNKDEASAALMEGVIYPEEVAHCAAGVRWLRHLHGVATDSCRAEELYGAPEAWPAWLKEARLTAKVEEYFHALVRANFFGLLRGPFNDHAREQAGFDKSWYEPLQYDADADLTKTTATIAAPAP